VHTEAAAFIIFHDFSFIIFYLDIFAEIDLPLREISILSYFGQDTSWSINDQMKNDK
jgi:hypothetical protein